MKEYLILMVALFVGLGLQTDVLAQEGPHKRLNKEERMQKYRAQKVAHITSELALSAEQAEKFWPVYNKYEEKKRMLRQEVEWKQVDDMTEEEAEAFLEKTKEVKEQSDELNELMMDELSSIISAKQQLTLIRAEKGFHREVAKRFQKRKMKNKRLEQAPTK